MELVRAQAGLTNYYHDQVIRNPLLDIDTTLIDKLTMENQMGGVSGITLAETAMHSAGLNAQASGMATIAGGWNETKGLMRLEFIVNQSPINVEYLNVIGYVTNNGAEQGLSTDALFTPVMSWKEHETVTSTLQIDNPTTIRRTVGGRTDYLLNDGSATTELMGMRPCDVIDFAQNRMVQEELENLTGDAGLDGMVPQPVAASADISRVGVVTSKRSNLNNFNYATELLSAGVKYQGDNMTSNSMLDNHGVNLGAIDSEVERLMGISHSANNAEPQYLRDDFFSELCGELGISVMRGVRGFTIQDLLFVYPNINDVLDLTFMDQSQFAVSDFTLDTEALGTSSMCELISHEITMNIMDLMLKHSLTAISFRGSNCDNHSGDGNLSNIVVMPYNPASLKNDDYDLGKNVGAFVNDLCNQFFAKLNGIRPGELKPIRFDVTAELFGTCSINITTVDSNNIADGFSISDSGIPTGMQGRSFPTYAINNLSSVLGNKQEAQVAGSNFFSNLQAYFS